VSSVKQTKSTKALFQLFGTTQIMTNVHFIHL